MLRFVREIARPACVACLLVLSLVDPSTHAQDSPRNPGDGLLPSPNLGPSLARSSRISGRRRRPGSERVLAAGLRNDGGGRRRGGRIPRSAGKPHTAAPETNLRPTPTMSLPPLPSSPDAAEPKGVGAEAMCSRRRG